MRGNWSGWLLPLMVLFISGCKEIRTNLVVLETEEPLVLSSKQGRLQLAPGTYPVVLRVSNSARDYDEVEFLGLDGSKQKRVHVQMKLPEAKKLLHPNSILEIPSSEIGQSVSLSISRQVDLDTDYIGLSLKSPQSEEIFTVAQFKHKSRVKAYDKASKEFLQSYQKVKRGQRAQ